MHKAVQLGILMGLVAAPALARADGLAGSPSSMVHQHEIAVHEAYSFLRTPKQVQALATSGALVEVTETGNLALSKVSYPFTRPEVRDFIERFTGFRDGQHLFGCVEPIGLIFGDDVEIAERDLK